MLTHLHIRDFAIIDAIEIDLRTGLTVLTGETGAGKSILVDALQLAAGGRAGSEVVRHGAERTEVTATFELAGAARELRALLEEQSIEFDDELVVRRVVTREGKSRAYLNGQQVPIGVLREAGEWFAEIHGQHEFQSLLRAAAQRQLLDTHAGAEVLASEVAQLHRERLARASDLEALATAARDRENRLDLLRHQRQELDGVAASPAELEALTAERSRLANAGKLAETARNALQWVYEADDGNAHMQASRALQALRQAASLDPAIAALVATLDEAVIRLADAGAELTRYLDSLEADPARQAQLEQRLATLESLARKHRVTIAELPAKAAEIEIELKALEGLEQNLLALEAAVSAATERWRVAARKLGTERGKAARALGAAITTRMQTLGMAGGKFVVEVRPLQIESSTPYGLEEIEFMVSANTGQPPRALAKVASGGELSRLSLAVQVTLANSIESSQSGGVCMVFDEVDSGVGGAVAEIVGRELAALGRHAQVLCVTHLPQVAALGDHHLRVSKLTDGKTTRTQITALEGAGRVEEIARMLGGIAITDTTRAHAAEMLGQGAIKPKKASGAGSSPADNGRKSRGRGR